MALNELTGEMVDTSSEEWRHRCECSWLLANKPTKADKHMYLFGVVDRAHLFDSSGELRAEHRSSGMKPSILKMRGLDAADRLLADAKRMYEARQAQGGSV